MSEAVGSDYAAAMPVQGLASAWVACLASTFFLGVVVYALSTFALSDREAGPPVAVETARGGPEFRPEAALGAVVTNGQFTAALMGGEMEQATRE